MAIYIQGIGNIGSQIVDARAVNVHWTDISTNPSVCQEPDYTGLIAPMQLRRMSKAVRMGIASAFTALKDAALEKPDIISIGTSYGCLTDTEFFLKKMIQQEESMLTPTAFIQSTHNTVSGQIALQLACHGQNFTFTQRGHSFEHALQDAMMCLLEDESKSILVGGIDELTEHSQKIIARFGTYKNNPSSFWDATNGTMSGEGSNMFVLSAEKNNNSYAILVDVHTCLEGNVSKALELFFAKNKLSAKDIDTCLLGINGDIRYDEIIQQNVASLHKATYYTYKNYVGEYPVNSAFAMVMGSMILKNNITLPAFREGNNNPENLLIYSHYKNQYHSFILLKKA